MHVRVLLTTCRHFSWTRKWTTFSATQRYTCISKAHTNWRRLNLCTFRWIKADILALAWRQLTDENKHQLTIALKSQSSTNLSPRTLATRCKRCVGWSVKNCKIFNFLNTLLNQHNSMQIINIHIVINKLFSTSFIKIAPLTSFAHSKYQLKETSV